MPNRCPPGSNRNANGNCYKPCPAGQSRNPWGECEVDTVNPMGASRNLLANMRDPMGASRNLLKGGSRRRKSRRSRKNRKTRRH